MIQTTQAELEAFYAKALPGFLEYVRTHSTAVEDVELATDMTGVSSLPCMYDYGGVRKVVRAPLTLISQEVQTNVDEEIEKIQSAANAAVQSANTAAGNANQAADGADDAAKAANSAAQAAADATAAANKAEQERAQAEAARVSAEQGRGQAEQSREQAEQERTSAFDTLKQNAETATQDATNAAERADELADHPPVIGDNGNWHTWDEDTGQYADTGALATGGVLYPTFSIDEDDMTLYMQFEDSVSGTLIGLDTATGELYLNVG